jgi:hypothetical protein
MKKWRWVADGAIIVVVGCDMVATLTVTVISGITLCASPHVRFIMVIASIRADVNISNVTDRRGILKKGSLSSRQYTRHPVYGAIACRKWELINMAD